MASYLRGYGKYNTLSKILLFLNHMCPTRISYFIDLNMCLIFFTLPTSLKSSSSTSSSSSWRAAAVSTFDLKEWKGSTPIAIEMMINAKQASAQGWFEKENHESTHLVGCINFSGNFPYLENKWSFILPWSDIPKCKFLVTLNCHYFS